MARVMAAHCLPDGRFSTRLSTGSVGHAETSARHHSGHRMRVSLCQSPRAQRLRDNACHQKERLRALPRNGRSAPMGRPTPVAIRFYRLYLRDAGDQIVRTHDVELGSDDDARQLAARMLNEQTADRCAEVWDRTRLVCTVRKFE